VVDRHSTSLTKLKKKLCIQPFWSIIAPLHLVETNLDVLSLENNIIAGGYKYYFPCEAALFLVHTTVQFWISFQISNLKKKHFLIKLPNLNT
jgi:hypothetical protein